MVTIHYTGTRMIVVDRREFQSFCEMVKCGIVTKKVLEKNCEYENFDVFTPKSASLKIQDF